MIPRDQGDIEGYVGIQMVHAVDQGRLLGQRAPLKGWSMDVLVPPECAWSALRDEKTDSASSGRFLTKHGNETNIPTYVFSRLTESDDYGTVNALIRKGRT